MRNTVKLFVLLLMLSTTVVLKAADEIPKASWRLGISEAPTLRLSPDGKRLTILNRHDMKIVDMQSMRCVYIDDYALQLPRMHRNSGPQRVSVVNATGEYVASYDTTGTMTWRRVSDTAVMSVSQLPREAASIMHIDNDTLAYVFLENRGYYVSLHGIVTPTQHDLAATNISDTLKLWFHWPYMYIIHRLTDDTLARLEQGEYLGVDFADRVYLFSDSSVVRYGGANGYQGDTVLRRAPDFHPIIRKQFLSTRDTLLDLKTNTGIVGMMLPEDLLPSSLAVKYSIDDNALFVSRPGGVIDTIPTLDARIVALLQDTRDSLLYFIAQDRDLEGWLQAGELGYVTDTSLYIAGTTHIGKWQQPKMIRDTLSTVVTTRDSGITYGYYGYLNLDRIRTRSSMTSTMVLEQFHRNEESRPDYDFSSRGDTLRSFKWYVDFGDCPTDTSVYLSSGVTGFVPTTPFYVVGRDLYSSDDCEFYVDLLHPVTAIAPNRDRVLITTDDLITLSEVLGSDFEFNATSKMGVAFGAWSDSGHTVRLIRNNNTIISMHDNGTTDSVSIPASMHASYTTWQWSNDGSVATGIKRDTLVAIDARTGKVLREYNQAPWLTYRDESNRAFCHVGTIDGRLVVSLPSGCFATFPGITLPVISSIAEASPLRPLPMHGTRIEGATPQSRVAVYSLVGSVVHESIVDESGSLDLADKGLPHGAYVAVYSTSDGMQAVRILH